MKILVPVVECDRPPGTVTIRDCATGQRVTLSRSDVTLVGGETVCIEAECVRTLYGECKVRLFGDITAWVRPLGWQDN